MYNYEQNNFTTVTPDAMYSSICVKGGIWFGGDNTICYYDYKDKTLKNIPIKKEDKDANPVDYRVQKMLYLEKDKILIGTRRKGMYLYDCRTQQLTDFISDKQYLLTSLYITADKHIYAAFYGHGLYYYDSNGNMQGHYDKSNSQLQNNYILDITEHNGYLWLATDGSGIFMLAPQSHQFPNYITLSVTTPLCLSIPLPYYIRIKKTNYGQEAYVEAYSVSKKLI